MENKKSCQNCKRSFTIEPDDFAFYEKISVPPPTFCPQCRSMRRFAWREFTTLYRDVCKLCGKDVISIHAPDGPFTIYCRDCWISDKWDPMEYGREYDFSVPFFAQYRKLLEVVPRPALTGNSLVQSEYTHASTGLKNCYMVFFSWYSEDCQNSFGLLFSKNTYDSWVVDNSDRVYESLHCNRLYNSKFLYYSDDCLDSSFLFDCVGCSSCFGCVNLRKQKYHLFNQPLTKDEYQKQMGYWDLGSYARLREAQKKFKELYLSVPHRYAIITSAVNVTGDIIRDTKNCQTCFTTLDGVENCKFIFTGGLNLKDSYDVNAGGDLSELMYETTHTTRAQGVKFANGSSNSSDVEYCDWAQHCAHVFGCVSIKHKQYCVLNKQYTRDEYLAQVSKIKDQMSKMPYVDKKGRVYKYGEFFPTELSVYAYNETLAYSWYPKTKDEVLAEGWQWRDPEKKNYQVTLKPEDLPDHIRDAQDDLTKEIIGCAHAGTCDELCTTAFRVTQSELDFYRQMNIALPRLCPNCRHMQRLKWRNRFTLYKRQCAKCSRDLDTTFSPDRPEIIYCDTCYKEEFL